MTSYVRLNSKRPDLTFLTDNETVHDCPCVRLKGRNLKTTRSAPAKGKVFSVATYSQAREIYSTPLKCYQGNVCARCYWFWFQLQSKSIYSSLVNVAVVTVVAQARGGPGSSGSPDESAQPVALKKCDSMISLFYHQ